MPATLLTTKTIIPSPGQIRLERPVLASKLDECLRPDCRLALISAPAGFGKTTLLSMWVARHQTSADHPAPLFAWYSLDSGDNDPVLFWLYVIAAFQTQLPEMGESTLALLQANPSPHLEADLITLVNELNQVTNPVALILDDFHLIRNPDIHRSLAFFIDHLPPQIHLLIASRTDPPLQLALLRGRGQLLEIRLNDLRFTFPDAADYLNSGMGLGLDMTAVQRLHDKTEGWIAGLQMVALTLQETAFRQDPQRAEAFITSFSGSNRYILDYLIEQVLDQQPEEIQNFLVRTSIVDKLCGPLCEALLADTGAGRSRSSQEILEYLEASNLFIQPLDQQRDWYRYHQLFADLLRKRLGQTDPASQTTLHRRALQWYEANDLIPNAIEQAFLLEDYPRAATLINQVCETLWGRGEHATLLGWIAALPETEKQRYPQLWVFQVSMLITAGKIKEAAACIPEIENYMRIATPPESNPTSFFGKIYSLHTYIASFHGDIPGVLHYARLALDNLSLQDDPGGRCGVAMVLSNAYLTDGDLQAANQALQEAIEAGESANRSYMVLVARSNLAIVAYTQGNLKVAAQACRDGLERVAQNHLERSPAAVDLSVVQGLIRYEGHDLETAEEQIHQGLEIARERSYIWATAWGYRGLIQLLLGHGDYQAAEKVVTEVDQFVQNHPIPEYLACSLAGLKADLWIRQGKLAQASQYLQSRAIRIDGELRFPHESEYLALARLSLTQGKTAAAESLLARILPVFEAAGQTLWSIRSLVLHALAFHAQGDSDASLRTLRRALDLGEGEGCLQTFIDEGEPMAHLLRQAIRQDRNAAYCRRLLAAFPDNLPVASGIPSASARRTSAPAEVQPASGLFEPLSKRELEVLRLIAEGDSNKDIAQKLYISVRTVKYYTTSIFTKMGVDRRAQAANKARQLGLVP